MDEFQRVCLLDELRPGQGRMVVVGGSPVCLFRIGDDVFALDDRCPHAGASLARGYLEDGVVRCRIHHWGFRIHDGVYVDEDNPRCNARPIPVRVIDGQVAVAMPKPSPDSGT